MKKKILVTGGAGYIGSHCVVKLLENGYHPIIFDDFSNSSPLVIRRLKEITGCDVEVIEGDVRKEEEIERVFINNQIDSVIHFAGKKSVNESQEKPLLYFSVNTSGSINLLNVMKRHNVKKIIFSSTATVYDSSSKECLSEEDKLGPVNNYGISKLMFEDVLRAVWKSDRTWKIIILRYFNPVGAHKSGLIGESPNGVPANLMPFISQVAIGKLPFLNVFGNDYNTRDGTGARDYIHVEDLALGHLKALEHLEGEEIFETINLGTGNNTTVLELIKAFEKANKVTIPYKITNRRPGDSGSCYADPAKAERVLHWVAKRNIEDMCRDSWNWQCKNPNGFEA